MSYTIFWLILNLKLSIVTVSCHQYHVEMDLIHRLNEFYHFDHNIFVLELGMDSNRFIPISLTGTSFTPRSIYTYNNLDDVPKMQLSQVNPFIKNRGKNTFVIVALETGANILRLLNNTQSLTQLLSIRRNGGINNNVKIGVFYTNSVKSMDSIRDTLRLSYNAGIVNLFSGFSSTVANDDASIFNGFS